VRAVINQSRKGKREGEQADGVKKGELGPREIMDKSWRGIQSDDRMIIIFASSELILV